MKKLSEILKFYGTDKARDDIGYTPIYDRIFNRNWERILEFGVYAGRSLLAWRDWFPGGAIIHGVDNCSIEPVPEIIKKEFKIHIGDVLDDEFMSGLSKNLGELDLVIEDSLHTTSGQIQVIKHFKNNIAKGGLLIVEDIDPLTPYERLFDGFKDWVPLTLVGYIRCPSFNLLVLERK